MRISQPQRRSPWIFYLLVIVCFLPVISGPIALVIGIALSLTRFSSPRGMAIGKITHYLLQFSVVMMGFTLNLSEVLETGRAGFVLTLVSVTATLTVGILLTRLFRIDSNTGLLISCGTAICGGSAIAAISPIIFAKKEQITYSLAIVFILNAVALLIFPFIGRWLSLTQNNFGYWAAIAIHDTSAVTGASALYGDTALHIATTVKLMRALWIIPLSFAISVSAKGIEKQKVKIPWFIFLFIAAILVRHLFSDWTTFYYVLGNLGKHGLVITLFLIGTSLSPASLQKVGFRPLLMGFILWILVSVFSLAYLNA